MLGTPWLPGAWKGFELMVDRQQSGQIAAEPIAKEHRNPQHHKGGQLDQRQRTLEGAWPHMGGQQEPIFRGKAHPHPLSSIAAFFWTLAICCCARRPLAQDEVPQFVQLHLRHLHLAQQVLVDLIGFFRRTSQPFQTRLFRHAHGKADGTQLHPAQQQLEHDHHLLFRGAQIIEHGVPCLCKLFATLFTSEDAPFPTLGLIGRYRLDVASVYQLIMTACRIGARLSPSFRLSHGVAFRYVWSRSQKHSRKAAPCLFQSITG